MSATKTTKTPPVEIIDASYLTADAPQLTQSEIAQLYPPNLRLKLVQIVHRHGARTPIMPGLTGRFPPVHANCYMGSFLTLHSRLSANDNSNNVSSTQYQKSLFNVEVWDEGVPMEHMEKARPGICYHGQLTDLGRDSMTQFGRHLRELYVDRLKFLPASFTDPATMYLRSTDYPRTLESLHSVLDGLYPSTTRSLAAPLQIHSRTPLTHETAVADWSACARYKTIKRQFDAVIRASVQQKLQTASPLVRELVKDAGDDPTWASDIAASALAHDQHRNVPLTQDDFRMLENLAVEQWFGHMYMYPVMRRFAIGRFLTELCELMDAHASPLDAAHRPSPFFSMHESHMEHLGTQQLPKFAAYSAHDTTVMPILLALNVWDGRWPPFGSHITLELFEDTAVKAIPAPSKSPSPPATVKRGVTSAPALSPKQTTFASTAAAAAAATTTTTSLPTSQHYVRAKYNGQLLRLPGCAAAKDHYPGDETLCRMDVFRKIVDAVAFKTQAEHREACRIGSSVM
ncbi:hypothetical protein RI367_000064 [Sorochytrium milnesiophthora]